MLNRLGQHFLKNQAALKKIVVALNLQKDDVVIEVGPGTGALTFELLKYPIELIAIEKDLVLARQLRAKIHDSPHQSKHGTGQARFMIQEGDVLKILPILARQWGIRNWKLIGNIPYYITGHLFRVIGELEHKPSRIVLTIQKEVAERVVAQPPTMNLLAASIQIWADVKIIDILPASYFKPPPKVDSAIITLTPKKRDVQFKMQDYYRLIKILFKQPRKTALNNLAAGLNISKEQTLERIRRAGLSGAERPHNLSIVIIQQLLKVLNF